VNIGIAQQPRVIGCLRIGGYKKERADKEQSHRQSAGESIQIHVANLFKNFPDATMYTRRSRVLFAQESIPSRVTVVPWHTTAHCCACECESEVDYFMVNDGQYTNAKKQKEEARADA
jgi:hypothetical protein